MKILLAGEYSNMHHTLAQAFRALGHEVLLISDGDGWKDYPRDIDLTRTPGFWGGLEFRLRLKFSILPKMKGFDVVHLINPQWLDVDPSFTRDLNAYLKRHNRLLSLGIYGDDYYILKGQNEGVLEYSDTFCYGTKINEKANAERMEKWTVACRPLCEETVAKADCLVASLYEYYKLYEAAGLSEKLHYIAEPIDVSTPPGLDDDEPAGPRSFAGHVRILVGEQSRRAVIKGTDALVPLLNRVDFENPYRLKIQRVQDVPFDEYQGLLAAADVLVDQMYSYTPAMNALEAMKRGTVVISGGEEEYYDFIGEKELRPIINLRPYKNINNLDILTETLLDTQRLRKMSAQSIEFVKKYHDAMMIARQYIELWQAKLQGI